MCIRDRISPARQAASSTQPIISRWRASRTRTNSPASTREVKVPVSSQAVPRSSTVTWRLPRLMYSALTSEISSSPRAEGSSLRAMSMTSLS